MTIASAYSRIAGNAARRMKMAKKERPQIIYRVTISEATGHEPIWLIGLVLGSLLIVAYHLALKFRNAVAAGNVDMSIWGQFGDFIGGLMNPAIGFLTIAGLLVTIHIQLRTLHATRLEAAQAARSAADQALMNFLTTKLAAIGTMISTIDAQLPSPAMVAKMKYENVVGEEWAALVERRDELQRELEGIYAKIRIVESSDPRFPVAPPLSETINDLYRAQRAAQDEVEK
ncbi:hypothetical protein GNX71_28565 [Variovorax sp. RKNM96]|uniref:hypothetical protein n=1 Tax=Variovorax sp. RKNM96 TaxID=2681552 RepID=UPI00197CF9E0|nr:hypothetical protein [Variovorax sp. RKNM96]QSI33307.1 hypothetical protein GNX71_28565 [Variovorax sp. RKNM96]